MKLYTLLFLVAAAVAPAQEKPSPTNLERSQEPDGFRGLKFGAPEAEANKTSVLSYCMARKIGSEPGRTCDSTYAIAGTDISGLLFFVNDKFVATTGKFSPKDYDKVRDVFSARYGKPHTQTTEELKTPINASYINETSTWRGKLVYMTLNKYVSNIREGAFVVGLISLLEAINQKSDSDKKKAADEL